MRHFAFCVNDAFASVRWEYYTGAVDTLYVRLPQHLCRRILLASANQKVRLSEYVRRQLDTWAKRDPAPDLPAVEGERNAESHYRIPVTTPTRKRVRAVAGAKDVSVNVLVVRVLDASTPHPTELLLEAVTGSAHV